MRVQSSQIERPAAVVCVRCSKFAKVQCGQAHCAGVAPGMTRATATSEEGGGAAARARGGGGAWYLCGNQNFTARSC